MIVERLKYQAYHKIYANNYFWRGTYDGSEVDLVEERDGKLYGYEFKWNPKKIRKTIPIKWAEYNSTNSFFFKSVLEYNFALLFLNALLTTCELKIDILCLYDAQYFLTG